MRYGSCGFGTPTSVLGKSSHYDFGIAIRRETDKPGIILVFFAFKISLLARDLSGAGFSGDIETLDLRIDTGSTLVDNAPHRLYDDIYSGFLDRIIFFKHFSRCKAELLQFLRSHKMGLLQAATGGQSSHGPCRLNRSNTDVALADCDRDRLTFIPFDFKDALLPFRGGDNAGVLV